MNDEPQEPRAGEERDDTPEQPVLRLVTRRVERRLPRVGTARFRAPSARAEAELAPFYADGADARAFANALIALALEQPVVSAADVDGWSERARAIARVATSEVMGCAQHYRRLAGSGLSGDERLLAAIRVRQDDIRARLRAANAALRASVVRGVDPTRVLGSTVVEQMLRQQRQLERMLRPPVIEQMLRLSTEAALFRSSYLAQIERLQRQLLPKPPATPFPRPDVTKLAFGFAHSPLFPKLEQTALGSVLRGYSRIADDVGRQLRGLGPDYFGALRHFSRLYAEPSALTTFQRLGAQLQRQLGLGQVDGLGRLFEQLRRPPWLDALREGFVGAFDNYRAWLEREWADLKARRTPPPLMFVLASLPALVGLQLLDELEADDELLLTRLEGELAAGTLAAELQAAV